jgi:hypothetical protein
MTATDREGNTMELFTRDMVLQGPPEQVRGWATRIAEKYADVTGIDVAVWSSIVGGAAGHHTWSATIDGSAELVDSSMEAMADASYLQAVEEGRSFFTGPPRDTLYRPYEDVEIDDGEPGNVCMVTTADAAAGHLGEAVGWALEMGHHVTKLTDIPTLVLGTAAGAYSRITWLAVAEDARAADQADRKSRSDDGYRKLLARGGPYFVDGSARSQLFLRLA